ncbi:MAG: PaaI family thioesterase [Parvularculales bacterium]
MTNSGKDDVAPDDNVPEGYRLSTTRGPYTSHNGPFYHKTVGNDFWHGVRILPRHCNSRGIAHGGMLMTFADGLLGTCVWRETGLAGLTMRLTSDFLAPVRRGEWLEGTAWVIHAKPSAVFCKSHLFIDKRVVLTADAVFRPMVRHKVHKPVKESAMVEGKT